MNTRASLAWLAALLGLGLGMGRPSRPRGVAPTRASFARLPRPTANPLDEDAEERNHAARALWIQQLHRAPAGTDTTLIERNNGLAQVRRRAELRRHPPATEPVARWQERGSDNVSGRIHVGRLSPDRATLYAGTSLGGVWKGATDGSAWSPIGDSLYGGSHWLEVLSPETAGDPDIVLAATDGGLVHRSTDGGETWEVPDGIGSSTWIRRMLALDDGSDAVFLLSWDGSRMVLLRSTDRAATFTEIADLGTYYGDLWAPRDGGDTLYLASAGDLLVSEDLGDTWTDAGTYDATSTRAELAGSEAGAPRLWVVTEGAHLLRSDDAGAHWRYKTELSDYWGTLEASIDDVDLFAYGGVDLYTTRDAGEHFSVVNEWYDYYVDPSTLLHADQDGLDAELDADGDEVWYISTDGGLYQSTDGLSTVQNLSLTGLRVSQYYSTLTSSADPTHVAAGAQDQGYQLTNGLAQDDEILEFSQALSGDYGQLTSSDGSHAYVYSVYPGFILVQVGEDAPGLYYLDFPSGESYVPWLPPIVADPEEAAEFYFPATHLYKYTFNPRTGGATYALWSDQDFSSDGYEYLSKVSFSPLDADRVYAATSYGRFFTSDDHGVTWAESPSLVPDDNWYYGQAIVASRNDKDLVYIGGSGYGVPAVRVSKDGGASFKPWGQGLPDTLVYSLCEAPDSSGQMFAGTETSAYTRGPDDDARTDITDADTPITTFWSCEALAAENTIRFGTYGRGIWDYQRDPDHTGCYPVQDYDGDGVDCDLDCEDHDGSVLPGGVETCGDGVDQDCDGADLACDQHDSGDSADSADTAETGDSADSAESAASDTESPAMEDKGGGCGCSEAGGGENRGWILGGLALALATARRKRGGR